MSKREVIPGIYSITNNLNGKVYIGQSKDILHRFNKHRWLATSTADYVLYSGCTPIAKALRTVGIDNFTFDIIEAGAKFEHKRHRQVRERYWIKRFNSTDPRYGYNETAGGEPGAYTPHDQPFEERARRAKPVFLYEIKTQSAFLYLFGAKGVADEFGVDKAITSHIVNDANVYRNKYYIIPAKYKTRHKILEKHRKKRDKYRNDPTVRPRTLHRVENSFSRYEKAVEYIDSIASEFGYECEDE